MHTAHSFMAIRLFVGLIVITLGTLLSNYVLFIPNPYNFRTLDRFKRSWLATAADIWNGLPAHLILQGEACGWCTILKDVQRWICT